MMKATMIQYVMQIKASIRGEWVDGKFEEYKDDREAAYKAGEYETEFNADCGQTDKNSPEWIAIRAVRKDILNKKRGKK